MFLEGSEKNFVKKKRNNLKIFTFPPNFCTKKFKFLSPWLNNLIQMRELKLWRF